MDFIFTDLSCEISQNAINCDKKGAVGATAFREKISQNIEMQNVDFNDCENRRSIVYFTSQIWEMNDMDFILLCDRLSKDLRSMTGDFVRYKNESFSVLTVGLGNPFFSTDSLGPETVKKIKTGLRGTEGITIYSVIPNVEMNTGIASKEHILALVKSLQPHLVIVIDSLAARSIERLASTVQISNFGLAPGSGLGRNRQKIDSELLGIPVISLGIPTVVNASTMMSEFLSKIRETENGETFFDDLEKRKNYFITPKEIELVIKAGSFLLSEAINAAFSSN